MHSSFREHTTKVEKKERKENKEPVVDKRNQFSPLSIETVEPSINWYIKPELFMYVSFYIFIHAYICNSLGTWHNFVKNFYFSNQLKNLSYYPSKFRLCSYIKSDRNA